MIKIGNYALLTFHINDAILEYRLKSKKLNNKIQ